METIGSIQQAVRAWRRIHRRGPLPVDLRRRVGRLAEELGENEARRAVGVRAAIIRRWREQYGSSRTNVGQSDRASFVALEPALSEDVFRGSKGSGMRIEVAGAGGCVVRIEGLRNPDELAAIVRCALQSGNGG